MMPGIIVFFIISFLRGIYAQYYGFPSASNLYQTYNYFFDPTPVFPYAYAPSAYPTSYAQPPTFAQFTPVTMYAPTPTPYPNILPTPLLEFPAPKCSPPTATAYYMTTGLKPSETASKEVEKSSLPKTIIATEIEKSSTPPAYSCPFCNGFKDIPKNPKVPPPPSCSAVLPGLLDKIPSIQCDCKPQTSKMPTIGLAESKCKLIDKLTSSTLLSDDLKKKLSGKLKFDEDLLDGFLTGIGLKKYESM